MPAFPIYGLDIPPATLLIGAGIGFAMVSFTRVLMTSVANADAGLASGLHNSARQLGGAIGIAGLGALAQTLVRPAGSAPVGTTEKLLGFHVAFWSAGIVSLVLIGIAMLFAPDERVSRATPTDR
jgi:predicted MFS family arabinose efflux permease